MSPVRVIDQDQGQLGVISITEAMTLARQAGLDLVEVSPTESPPVCRIMNYGKYKYEKKKRQKQGAGGHVVLLKEIRMRPKTDDNDRLIKLNRAKGFLGEGHKVQFTMLFRGRERFHRERAREMFDAVLAELGETVKVERHPAMEGRRMTMVVAPTKQAAKEARDKAAKAATSTPTPSAPIAKEAPPNPPETPPVSEKTADRVAEKTADTVTESPAPE